MHPLIQNALSNPFPVLGHEQLSAQGSVPAGVMVALIRYTESLGYTVAMGFGPEDIAAQNERDVSWQGLTSPPLKEVWLRPGLTDADTLHVLAHELGHIVLGHVNMPPLLALLGGRETGECEADTFAYEVCTALGVDSTERTLSYLSSWKRGAERARDVRPWAQRMLRSVMAAA